MKSKYVQYYVEGKDEKRLIDVLKTELGVIRPGKVLTLNPVAEEITQLQLRTLQTGTMAVLVFDTDAGNVEILKNNIKTLKACKLVSETILIPQVSNLEDELVRSCCIRDIKELLNSKSRKEFKHDLLCVTNLKQKLQQHHFDINLFLAEEPPKPYHEMTNQSARIKLK